MKRSLIVLPFITLLVLMVISFGFSSPVKKTDPALPGKGFAVVELFTSEGCSSCPAADEAVAALAKDYPTDVYVLGFHVDYWNYLGWKDAFSTAGNTSRQEAYASYLKLNSIYTPQVVVNGKTEFTGSDRKKLYATVAAGLQDDNNTTVDLIAKPGAANEVLVTYKLKAPNASLNIALVQLQVNSPVKRGENNGRILHHVNIVRNFKTVEAADGSVSISLPDGLRTSECKIIAFVQNKTSLQITGAAATMIQ